MALLPFDELNTPKVEVEPPEKYFSKMAISKEQKEERVEAANDIMSVLLFLFALLAIEMQEPEPDYDMVYRSFWLRFRDAVAKHSRMDDYQNNYVNEFTQNAFDVTRRHMEASSVGTDGRTDAGWWTSPDRAMAMGENEANSVLNYEDLQKAIDKGYTTKTWVTERDNRVRDTHKAVDGVTIPINEYFVVGDGVMLAPHDEYNNPAECANCRCSLNFGIGTNAIVSDIIREKAKPINTIDDLRSVSKSSIIDMKSFDEIINYFKEEYNIEVENFKDNPKKLHNKAPFAGLDDMLIEFPEIRKRIKKVVYDEGLKDLGTSSQFGIVRIGSKGLQDYGTGIHEATHILDFKRDLLQETYAKKVYELAMKNLGLRKNGREVKLIVARMCGEPKYVEDAHEVIAFAMETAKGGRNVPFANEIYRIIKEGDL